MKILFICNTYYQIIIALQLKFTYFKENQVDLWLSDRSVNAKLVCSRLAKLNIFRKTEFKEIKHDKLGINEFAAYLKSSFGIIDDEKFDFYDEIIFFNLEMILFKISDFYKKNKFVTTWSKMEEGVLSYETDFDTGKGISVTRFLREKFGLQEIVGDIKNYYCFFPELKLSHKEWNFIKIPPITTNFERLKSILNYIFNNNYVSLNQKYIYFASAPDLSDNKFDESKIILKIAKTVGKDNLIVKKHPRDSRNVYSDKGIKVMENSYIPWEVIQMNINTEQHILLTTLSGAFLNISALSEQNIKGYFLYNAIPQKEQKVIAIQNKIDNIINALHSLDLANNLFVYSIDI